MAIDNQCFALSYRNKLYLSFSMIQTI